MISPEARLPETQLYNTGLTTAQPQNIASEGTNQGITSLTQADINSLLPAARQYWLNAGASAAVLDAAQISIANLPAGVAGQTQGNQITLSADGAGWGWFVDSTPALPEEFTLQTNATLQANPDTAASGKLDLLTVMIHELGHRLGLAHDSAGAMEATVQAGERQLPSAAEIALMQNIRNAITTKPLDNAIYRTRVTQYAVTANATLTNGSLNAADGWSTQGSVDITNGIATLNEVATRQTRLSQVFMLGANDRYLSFTLSGAALDAPHPLPNPPLEGAGTNAALRASEPSDAFEVALLNANTGASLLDNNGLSHSDAFLNLQADGTEHTSSGVTRIINADGSRTYRIDLTGIPAGVAANLSFDLIGFGANASHVTVSDVRLSSLPQLHDLKIGAWRENGSAMLNSKIHHINIHLKYSKGIKRDVGAHKLIFNEKVRLVGDFLN